MLSSVIWIAEGGAVPPPPVALLLASSVVTDSVGAPLRSCDGLWQGQAGCVDGSHFGQDVPRMKTGSGPGKLVIRRLEIRAAIVVNVCEITLPPDTRILIMHAGVKVGSRARLCCCWQVSVASLQSVPYACGACISGLVDNSNVESLSELRCMFCFELVDEIPRM